MATKKIEDLDKIEKAFEKLGGNKAILGLKLLKEAQFHEKTLETLRANIEANGATSEMCQGSYSITRENPELKSYNTMVKNYQSLIKQINDLLGTGGGSASDELEEFLKQ